MNGAILSIRDLQVAFRVPLGLSHALRGVSFDLEPASILGLVGESGCGKTVTGRSILRLLPENALVTGAIRFGGEDLLQLSAGLMHQVRGRRIAMVFQDPAASLNPVFTIGEQLSFAMGGGDRRGTARATTGKLLEEVGLPNPGEILQKYPHQLSGGQQQRIMIALALVHSPDLLIADEPTTSLDVTVQAQILDLLLELRRSRGLSVLLITHNMAVVAQACQRVAVLYAGQLVEIGAVADVLERPEHPYTRALLSSLPTLAAWRQPLTTIPGVVPPGSASLEACGFASRCPFVMDVCVRVRPKMVSVRPGQEVACWLHPGTAAPS